MEAQMQQMQFEEAMQKLSKIVERLESGEGSLDEMIQLYEEGMTLVRACESQLDAYEATIVQLSEVEGAKQNAE
jgi:exodeoxyribonuclease VII small subunit